MGQAHHNPPAEYERTYKVTQHAIERLRERFIETKRIDHRSDWDLGNALDRAVALKEDKRVTLPSKDGKPTYAIPLAGEFEGLYVILKPSDAGYGPKEALITVIPNDPSKNQETTSRGTLAEKFPKGLLARLESSASAHESAKPSTNGHTAVVATAPAQTASSAPVQTTPPVPLLIRWREANGSYLSERADTPTAVSTLLARLSEADIDPATIELWEPSKRGVRVRLALFDD